MKLAPLEGFEPTCVQLAFHLFRRQRAYSGMRNCEHCGNKTKNLKYCSRSCAASVNGSKHPKRSCGSMIPCETCGVLLKRYMRKKRCNLCPVAPEVEPSYLSLTLRDIQERYGPGKPKGLNRNAAVRNYCGRMNYKLKNTPCQLCGYSSHVELCHIRPISDFPDDASIREINSETNIVVLCPNHHWELDNGFLDFDVIPKRR